MQRLTDIWQFQCWSRINNSYIWIILFLAPRIKITVNYKYTLEQISETNVGRNIAHSFRKTRSKVSLKFTINSLHISIRCHLYMSSLMLWPFFRRSRSATAVRCCRTDKNWSLYFASLLTWSARKPPTSLAVYFRTSSSPWLPSSVSTTATVRPTGTFRSQSSFLSGSVLRSWWYLIRI